ncbi:MAG: hypothetical protein M1820_009344 [Bogoriella megaspora]|nr:MAG: hypothetical protein M1820_009344 [Bogoriella megaspora]
MDNTLLNDLQDFTVSEVDVRHPYRTLPTPTSIRILDVLPSDLNRDGCIQASFKVADLNDLPTYCALSYTWDNPRTVMPLDEDIEIDKQAMKRKYDIFCDGTRITIPANCHLFLVKLQSLKKAAEMPGVNQTGLTMEILQYIWIDSICINQESKAERSSQVRIMDRIYRQAQVVLVWLGPPDSLTSDAMRVFLLLSKEVSPEKARKMRNFRITNPNSYKAMEIPFIGMEKWEAVYAFLMRSWFFRAWTVQEVAVARERIFMCGSMLISWDTLCAVMQFFFSSSWLFQLQGHVLICIGNSAKQVAVDTRERTGPPAVNENLSLNLGAKEEESKSKTHFARLRAETVMRDGPYTVDAFGKIMQITLDLSQVSSDQWENRGTTLPLQPILSELSASLTTLPEDQIYAFLGLVPNASWHGLTIDYTRPVQQTYLQATWATIRATKTLRILSRVEDRAQRRIHDIPSWVPDFSVPANPIFYDRCEEGWGIQNDPPQSNFYASAQGSVFSLQSEDELQNFIQAEGIYYATINGSGRYGIHCLHELDPLMDIIATLPSDYLWRTLIADNDNSSGGRNLPAPESCGKAFFRMVKKHLFSLRNDVIKLGSRLPESYDEFRQADAKFKRDFDIYTRLNDPDFEDLLDGHRAMISTFEKLSSPESADLLASFSDAFSRKLNQTWNDLVSEGFEQYGSTAVDWFFNKQSVGRKLFSTDKNSIGMGPKSAAIGDEIWMIASTKVPYVLRLVSPAKYELVGEAFVHGIMYGEAWREKQTLRQSITLV